MRLLDKEDPFGNISTENQVAITTPTVFTFPFPQDTAPLPKKKPKRSIFLRKKDEYVEPKRMTNGPRGSIFTGVSGIIQPPQQNTQNALGINPLLLRPNASPSNIGIPTFAILSAEVSIRTAAEFALHSIINELNSFPASGNVAHIMASINEQDEIVRLNNERSKMEPASGISIDDLAENDYSEFIHCFAVDKKSVISIIEQPVWSLQNNDKENHEAKEQHEVIVITRDYTTKQSFRFSLRCKDTEQILNQSMVRKPTEKKAREGFPGYVFSNPYSAPNSTVMDYKYADECFEHVKSLEEILKVNPGIQSIYQDISTKSNVGKEHE